MGTLHIDAHQHFWQFNAVDFGWIGEEECVLKRDFLPNDLKLELSEAEYCGSIAVQARQSLEETKWLLELAQRHEHILGVVGWVDLQNPKVDRQLDEFSDNRWLKGIRHVIQDEPDDQFMLSPSFLRGISKLAKRNLVYEILIYAKQLPYACELVKQFPRQKFVLDHIAKPNIKDGAIDSWALDIEALAASDNVSVKVSGMVTEADHKNWKPADFTPYLDVIMDAFGEDRILVGSDWPVCLLAGSYSQVVRLAERYFQRAGKQFMDKIQGDNARRIYGL